jgi:hypothetical protein
MISCEKQGGVHRHASEDRLFDRRPVFLGAGNLGEQVVPLGFFVKCFGLVDDRFGVVGSERRDSSDIQPSTLAVCS